MDSIEIDGLLFEFFHQKKRVMPHFHLSMQSGDNMILKDRKEGIKGRDAIDFCNKIKLARPEVIFWSRFNCWFPYRNRRDVS